MILSYIFSIIFFSLSRTNFPSALGKLSCTVNGLTHNYLAITDPVYDTDSETTIPYTYHLPTENVSGVQASTWNIRASLDQNKNLLMSISAINEKGVQSQGKDYHLKFVLTLRCTNGSTVSMNTVVPFVDSNNHQPFFSKPKYVYNLISTYEEDFKRQLELNPIVATDYDVTNGELVFDVQGNEYFKVLYGGVVPGTLNKKHFAQLVPKFPGKIITKKVEVIMTVTDIGNPPKSNTSKVVINPPSPPTPAFKKPFYVGHLYKNGTFEMSENPELEEGVTYYQTSVQIESCSYYCNYYATISEGQIIIVKNCNMGDSFYRFNYLACSLTAKYTDPITKLFSTGNTALIVEHHHNL
ncbi:uncharacterized protein LOC135133608 [Zophobas morio]|uniref:uncharacterized protein LOC135133608 n=1 Tax=Zophobas morio TaxID=2755281 RepID=UPI003083E9B5